MITVYQLSIGETTIYINKCMDSVRAFAFRNGFEYQLMTELSNEIKSRFGSKNIRNLSDFWKIDILANKCYSLVIDRDVFLSDIFSPDFTDNILINHMGDNFLYNGAYAETFTIIKETMVADFRSEEIRGQLFHAFCKCIREKKININEENILNETGYSHGNQRRLN